MHPSLGTNPRFDSFFNSWNHEVNSVHFLKSLVMLYLNWVVYFYVSSAESTNFNLNVQKKQFKKSRQTTLVNQWQKHVK